MGRSCLCFRSFPKTASALGTPPPPGSLVHALLATPLNSAITQKGAEVEALISQPLFDGDYLILPQGSRLRGSVLQVRPARHLHRNGQLRIAFRELVLPEGTVQKVDTSLEGVQSGA
jgi:type IV secretory pathway VirB10-like protein